MDFERGKEIKEAIGVGLKANAPLIQTFYHIDIEVDMTGVQRRYPMAVDPKEVFEILTQISNERILPDLYAFEEEWIDNFHPTKIQMLEDYKGKYVRYSGLFIPPSAFEEREPSELIRKEAYFLIPE